MKLLIAAESAGLDAKIAKRFGHAPCYLILDTGQLDFTVVDGPAEDEPSYDFNRFAGKNIDGVILGNIGPQAFMNLQNLGWSIYSCIGSTVREAVQKVCDKEVDSLTDPTMKVSVHSGSQGKNPGGNGMQRNRPGGRGFGRR